VRCDHVRSDRRRVEPEHAHRLRRVERVPETALAAELADRLDRSTHPVRAVDYADADGTGARCQESLDVLRVEAGAAEIGHDADADAEISEVEERRQAAFELTLVDDHFVALSPVEPLCEQA
jgi:hypothetical protein